MIIAVTAEGTAPQSKLDPRFGRSKYFLIYNESNGAWECVDNNQNLNAAQGAGIQAATIIAQKKCNVIITGHCGPKAFRTLAAAGVEVYLCDSGTVEESLHKYQHGVLKKISSADVEGHW